MASPCPYTTETIVSGKSYDDGSKSPKTELPLAPEIVELIFWHMDEATFFISLQVCKQFWKAAASRKNIIRQVSRLTGPRFSFDDLSGDQLRRICYERAAESGIKAGVLADIRKCRLPSGTMLSKSAFSSNAPTKGCWAHHKDSQLALVNEDGTITVYGLSKDDVRLNLTLHLHRPGRRQSPVNVYAMAFSPKGDLIVLHDEGANMCHHDDKELYHHRIPEDDSSHKYHVPNTLELTTFYGCNSKLLSPTIAQNNSRRSRITTKEGSQPIGIALACNGNASIAWKGGIARDPLYWVDLIRTSNKGADDVISVSGNVTGVIKSKMKSAKYRKNTVVGTFDPFPRHRQVCEIIRMHFVENDRKLLLHHAALPVHYVYKRWDCAREGVTAHSNLWGSRVHGPDNPWSFFHIGTPFHGTHSKDFISNRESGPLCLKSYLAVGVLIGSRSRSQIACDPCYLFILHFDEFVDRDTCKHSIYLDEDRTRSEWIPVALLAGWRQSQSTVGSLLEISPKSKRIASAAWNRVLVWTLDPHQLHQGAPGNYFPCRDYNAQKGFGRIRPVVLPPQGVIHALKWIDECNLFALTDCGLVKWYIGPLATGKRDIDTA